MAGEDRPEPLDDFGRGGLADEQARHLDRQHDRDHHEEHTDGKAARGVPTRLVRNVGEDHAGQREEETDERADVLQHDHRQLRDLRAADELEYRLIPTLAATLPQRGPQ